MTTHTQTVLHQRISRALVASSLATLVACATSTPSTDPSGTSSTSQEGSAASSQLASSSASSAGDATGPSPTWENLYAVLADDPSFSTLVSAIDVASFRAQLTGSDARTFLAPNNDAFARLSKQERDTLFADPARMTQLLSHHLIEGTHWHDSISSGIFVSRASYPLLGSVNPEGSALVASGEGTVQVERRDFSTHNGVVHETSSILPLPRTTLLELLASQPELSTFSKLTAQSGALDPRPDQPASLTVLAPSNQAFKDLQVRMGSAAYQALIQDPQAVAKLVRQHVHTGLWRAFQTPAPMDLPTLEPTHPIRYQTQGAFPTPTLNGRPLSGGSALIAKGGLVLIVTATLHDSSAGSF